MTKKMTGKQNWNLAQKVLEENSDLLCEIYKSMRYNTGLTDHIDTLQGVFSDFRITHAVEKPFYFILDIGNNAPHMQVTIYEENDHIKIHSSRIKN